MSVNNPHDTLIKFIFKDIVNCKDYFRNYLPERYSKNLNLDSIQIQPDSFIDPQLKNYFSDLVFRVDFSKSEQAALVPPVLRGIRTSLYSRGSPADTKQDVSIMPAKGGYIYILFEHKSSPEKNTSFQLLRYMVRIWEKELLEKKQKHLSIILPLVFYHGKSNWNIPNDFSSLFEIQEYPELIPNFYYTLHNISTLPDSEILGNEIVRPALLLMKNIFRKDFVENLPKIVAELKNIFYDKRKIDYIETFLMYIFNVKDIQDIKPEIIIKIIDQEIEKGKGELVMTIAEKLRKEGMEKGMEKGKLEDARNMLAEGISLKIVLKVTGLSKEDLLKAGILDSR